MSDLCRICGEGELAEVPAMTSLARVTSDCKPWPAGGHLAICRECGAVQKPVDQVWREEVGRIYGDYELYWNATEIDQIVFDEQGGALTRTARLVDRLIAAIPDLPEQGRLLDAGCGRGAFLRSFARRLPRWALVGWDVSGKVRSAIESIPGASFVKADAISEVKGTYDLVAMTHVLEHVVDPVPFLLQVRQKIAPGGRVFVQVPSFRDSAFDLLVADHCAHFDELSLNHVLRRAGFAIEAFSEDWIRKELSALAKLDEIPVIACAPGDRAAEDVAEHQLAWLTRMTQKAKSESGSGEFGIFGTALGGVWLDGQLQGRAKFFVDEDRGRAGRTFFGRPVYLPGDVPDPAKVLIPMPTQIATSIARRLARPRVDYIVLGDA